MNGDETLSLTGAEAPYDSGGSKANGRNGRDGGGKESDKNSAVQLTTLPIPQYTPVLKPNPEASANFFSRCTLLFMTPFMFVGWKKTLQAEDMFEPLEESQSEVATGTLRESWKQERARAAAEGRAPSFKKTIFRTYGSEIIRLGILLLIEEMVKLCQPISMSMLIAYFNQDSTMSRDTAFIAAAGVTLTGFISCTIHHPYFYGLQKIGMKIKAAVSGLIVEKGVRLSSSALHKTTVGHYINILSTDVSKFDSGFIFIHYMWVGPILLFGYGALIWQFIGVSTLTGFAVIVVLMPIQAFFGKAMGTFRRITAARADKRISVMSEILNGIKVIKMYSWEDAFSSIIDKLRSHEMQSVKRYGLVQSTMLGLFWATGKLVVLGAALTFLHLGNTLTADKIFVAAALFNSCRLPVTLFLPFSFHCLFDMLVAIERIQKVLLLDEFGSDALPAIEGSDVAKANGIVSVKGGDGEKLLEQVDEETAAPGADWQVILPGKSDRAVVDLRNFTATWETTDEKEDKDLDKSKGKGKEAKEEEVKDDGPPTPPAPAIEDVTLKAEVGQVVAVIGPVGAGKSSLLASILRETRRLAGTVRVEGQVAYCSQEAWIFSGTLRENILFGTPFEEERYRRAIELSALATDLGQLPRGDATIVGDRGTSLSGGQKARVSLARALYRDADIYLLDDPLSAVDASVGRFIYEKCISSALKTKVVILVTHQVQFVDSAELLVVMKGGRIVVSGPPDRVWEEHPEEMKEIIQETRKSYRRRQSTEKSARSDGGGRRKSEQEEGEDQEVSSDSEVLLEDDALVDGHGEKAAEKEGGKGDDGGVEEEESAEGSVPWSIYWEYIKAMSARRPLLVGPIWASVIIAQFMFVIVDWWMNKWCNASEKSITEGSNGTNWSEDVMILGNSVSVTANEFEGWYSGLTIFLLFIAVGRCIWFRLLEVDASRYLHKRMFDAIVHTGLHFFDRNPIGRILNRFSKDISTMDDLISMVFFEFVVGMLNFLSLIGMIFFLNPWIIVPTLPLVVVFYFLRELYLATSRDIKRLEATSRSPLYSHISALMNGLITIRAFGCEKTVLEKYHEMQNINVASFYLTLSTSRWFAIWIDWLVTCFCAFVAFLCIFTKDIVSSGEMGLMLMYALQLTGFFSWIMRQSAELQNGMVSIERIVNYSKLEPEETVTLPIKAARSNSTVGKSPTSEVAPDGGAWPSRGHVELRDLWMRYAEGADFVLKGVTLDIMPGEKIGIVGRTGAGKSSLLRALFRLTLPHKGHVIIDDVDTSTVPLRTLRKSIGIIPQEPVLFVGSIRKNLDPFDEFADDALWKALELVELRTFVSEMPGGLTSSVQEGGANVSVGQRQLLCLARALLRRTTILVIDEATANVDNKTDALIQRTIRSSFAHATVLTIAHRLHTIMDSSRVLVLDHGEVMQFDKPHTLLESDGIFSQLVAETGRANELHLREMAKAAFESSLGSKPAE